MWPVFLLGGDKTRSLTSNAVHSGPFIFQLWNKISQWIINEGGTIKEKSTCGLGGHTSLEIGKTPTLKKTCEFTSGQSFILSSMPKHKFWNQLWKDLWKKAKNGQVGQFCPKKIVRFAFVRLKWV